VPAVTLSETMMQCVSPSQISPGACALGITSNFVDLVFSLSGFRFVESFHVTGLSPSRGPEDGGAVITLIGTGFASDRNTAQCRVGAAVLQAQFVTSTQMQCVLPGLAAGSYRLEFSQRGAFSNSELELLIYRMTGLLLASPSMGPERGGTLVSVHGFNFWDSTGWRCVFGSSRTAATFSSESALRCQSPPNTFGLVQVTVENAVPSGWISEVGVPFQFFATFSVLGIRPSLGPNAGGTVVSVAGFGFPMQELLMCSFGWALTTATVLTSSSLQCVSPEHSIATVTTKVVTSESAYSVAGPDFSFTEDAYVSMILPSLGPDAGGTLLNVTGLHFSVNGHCRFGTELTVASFVSETFVQCKTPALALGSYAWSLTHNGVDFTKQPLVFLITPPVVLLAAVREQTDTAHPFWITVTGHNFWSSSSLACKISAHAVLSAQWVTSTQVRCRAQQVAWPKSYALQISNNGVDFSEPLQLFFAETSGYGITPDHGAITGGSLVTIGGVLTSFGSLALCRSLPRSPCTPPLSALLSELWRCAGLAPKLWQRSLLLRRSFYASLLRRFDPAKWRLKCRQMARATSKSGHSSSTCIHQQCLSFSRALGLKMGAR
jgi:hypothetical protein